MDKSRGPYPRRRYIYRIAAISRLVNLYAPSHRGRFRRSSTPNALVWPSARVYGGNQSKLRRTREIGIIRRPPFPQRGYSPNRPNYFGLAVCQCHIPVCRPLSTTLLYHAYAISLSTRHNRYWTNVVYADSKKRLTHARRRGYPAYLHPTFQGKPPLGSI